MNNDIKRKSYIWNTISSMINAGQSAIILVFISNMYSIEEAGIFSIGYAISLLGMTFSKYGQRNFQVTDVNEDYSFVDYRNARWLAMVFVVLILSIYLGFKYLIGGYSLEKMITVLLLCLWKQIDSIEDVYYGMYQQRGRLDIGAKRYSERLIFSTVLFCVLTLFRLPFLLLIFVLVFLSALVAFFLIRLDALNMMGEKLNKESRQGVTKLLRECVTLCVSSVLAVYIGNLPKYFIDIYLNDRLQAQFGYLMMPAFVSMILSMVIFQPIIKEMGEAVHDGNYVRLSGYIKKQLIYITIITVIMLVVGGILGIPVLNILYNVDLSEYWKELMILFIGGGFYAISQFMIVPIVSMRRQNDIAVVYVFSTIISMIVGIWLVPRCEIWGASILYLIINILLTALLIVDYRILLRKRSIVTKF